NVKPNKPHPALLALVRPTGRGGQERHLRIRARSTPGQSPGGQLQTAGSQPIENTAACPTSESQEAPIREHDPTLRPRPDDAPRTPRTHLHPPTTTSAYTRNSATCRPPSTSS